MRKPKTYTAGGMGWRRDSQLAANLITAGALLLVTAGLVSAVWWAR